MKMKNILQKLADPRVVITATGLGCLVAPTVFTPSYKPAFDYESLRVNFDPSLLPDTESHSAHPEHETTGADARLPDSFTDQLDTNAAYALTWDPNSETCDIGHQALLYNHNGEWRYISCWPSPDNPPIPVSGPFIVAPFSAVMVPYQHDFEQEHNSEPTSILRINGLDITALALTHQELEQAIEEDRCHYVLLRHFNLSPVLNSIYSPEVRQAVFTEPFSGLYDENDDFPQAKEHEKKHFVKPQNCTSVVMEALAAAGFPRPFFDGTPWGSAPWSQAIRFKIAGGEHVKDVTGDEKLRVISVASGVPASDDYEATIERVAKRMT